MWQTNLSEVEELRNSINSNMTWAQFKAFLNTTAWLMKWRVESLWQSWTDKFWTNPPKPILNSTSKSALKKLWLDLWQSYSSTSWAWTTNTVKNPNDVNAIKNEILNQLNL